MKIDEQFNLIAQEYDANRRRFIPCFDDFYENSTKMILSNIGAPKRVLDLGAGTGLLTSFWFKACPDADYVLVDIADEMLDVSKRRFAGLSNVEHHVLDYTEQFPSGSFDVVLSALSIHHLSDTEKSGLFRRIYDQLPAGGIFVNYDQFCADTPQMNDWFNSYWEQQLYSSDLTSEDLARWQERRKLDRECSVNEQSEMLRLGGFPEVQCIYQYQIFAVLVAVK